MINKMQKKEQINIRLLVMDMLLAVTRDQEYSHIVVREVQNKYNYLTAQEKSFLKRLFEGTLERMIELDYVINQYSTVKTSKMKPVIRTIMRMGVYQILYMDAVPDSAACNEAVKLAQKKGFASLKGFVNGVLRNIARQKEKITYPDQKKEPVLFLSVTYSMPEWIVKLWLEQLGEDTTIAVLKGLLQEHPVTVRFRSALEQDTRKERQALEQALQKQGGSLTGHAYLPYAYRMEKTEDIARLPGYREGSFVIQDISSMLAIEALGIENFQTDSSVTILDICAAPGGKSMLAADKVQNRGSVEARDISENKVLLMQENFDRCGLTNAKAVVWDALEQDKEFAGKADIVIADVPCSGLGVMGRKRDIKYKMTLEAAEEIAGLQRKILQVAASYVKPGGKLLFSTCTINKKENEENAQWIQDKLSLTPAALDEWLPKVLHSETTKKGYLQLLPGIHDADGFFISVFTK